MADKEKVSQYKRTERAISILDRININEPAAKARQQATSSTGNRSSPATRERKKSGAPIGSSPGDSQSHSLYTRGSGAYGYFQLYESLTEVTEAGFLTDPSRKTPVFVRFSNLRSAETDLARDVRGFAVKFYTEEGVFDLLGHNMPVFFVKDASKFPRLIQALDDKQGNKADTFWSFVSENTEALHQVMWLMSDRGLPRSWRMMEGFSVNNYLFTNDKGQSQQIRFYWKPLLGVYSVTADEAKKISAHDPDFLRRDLWESIENGHYPEWELGIQKINADSFHNIFDSSDPTMMIPEELAPIHYIGKIMLNRNPEHLTESDMVLFHPGHMIPGIDLPEDQYLTSKLYFYRKAQAAHGRDATWPVKNQHPDKNNPGGAKDPKQSREIIQKKISLAFQSLGEGLLLKSIWRPGRSERQERRKAYHNYATQPGLFYRNLSKVEKRHLTEALSDELLKIQDPDIREKVLQLVGQADSTLAMQVADSLGIKYFPPSGKTNGNETYYYPTTCCGSLSQLNHPGEKGIDTRKVAILVANGVDEKELWKMKKDLVRAGAFCRLVSLPGRATKTVSGETLKIDYPLNEVRSVIFDAVYLPGGKKNIEKWHKSPAARSFIKEAFDHGKALTFSGEAAKLQGELTPPGYHDDLLLIDPTPAEFIYAIGKHRVWDREVMRRQ